MKPATWYDALHHCQTSGQGYAIVTVMTAAGSTPREAGTKMIVTADSQYDTIGGGHLEYQAVAKARALLATGEQTQHIESYPLASKLGQCCGGAMKVLFEVLVTHEQTLAIFGGGHVAQALVPIVAQLPLQIRWIDSRRECFQAVSVAANVSCIVDDDPLAAMTDLPPHSWVVILTHNHQLDYRLVECALRQCECDFLGMIGSATKAKRFRTRLAHRGYSASQIAQLISPIGELSIAGKRPIEVAVAISAQIIQQLNPQGATPARPSANALADNTPSAEPLSAAPLSADSLSTVPLSNKALTSQKP